MKSKKIIIGFLITCVILGPVSAVDWPMFHGNPEHTGFLEEPSDFAPHPWTT